MAQIAKRVLDGAKPLMANFVKYAKVELIPPKPNEFGQVAQGFKGLINSGKSGKWKQITVREAWLNTLVTMEVLFWFYAGECIGKGALVGYQIDV